MAKYVSNLLQIDGSSFNTKKRYFVQNQNIQKKMPKLAVPSHGDPKPCVTK